MTASREGDGAATAAPPAPCEPSADPVVADDEADEHLHARSVALRDMECVVVDDKGTLAAFAYRDQALAFLTMFPMYRLEDLPKEKP